MTEGMAQHGQALALPGLKSQRLLAPALNGWRSAMSAFWRAPQAAPDASGGALHKQHGTGAVAQYHQGCGSHWLCGAGFRCRVVAHALLCVRKTVRAERAMGAGGA